MANTDKTYSVLNREIGSRPISSSSSWVLGSWVKIIGSTSCDIYINGFQFQTTYVSAADTTREQLWEIGIGGLGSEVTQLQFPSSFRNDTAVGYYLDTKTYFLPEPYFVPMGSRISVRVANGHANAVTYEGVKLMYQAAGLPLETDVQLPNNYQHARCESAGIISMGEKIR
jgi:hypothetical protein